MSLGASLQPYLEQIRAELAKIPRLWAPLVLAMVEKVVKDRAARIESAGKSSRMRSRRLEKAVDQAAERVSRLHSVPVAVRIVRLKLQRAWQAYGLERWEVPSDNVIRRRVRKIFGVSVPNVAPRRRPPRTVPLKRRR